MSKNFNLWLLHKSSDVHPRSWICVSGDRISNQIYELELDVLKELNLTRESLSKLLANKLQCNYGVIKQLLQGKRKFYPIPIILELVKLTKRNRYYLKTIHKSIKYLKTNSATSKPIKLVKNLTIDISKIIGAFMADGNLSFQVIVENRNKLNLEPIENELNILRYKFSKGYSKTRNKFFLSTNANYKNFDQINNFIMINSKGFNILTHYNLEITDEHKNNVESFNRWMKNTFDINPSSFNKIGNAWRSIFSNKVMARVLITYFEIKSGYKTDIAFEPLLIKNSNLNFRKAFVLGVMTFDGSITISGNLTLTIKSRYLYESVQEVLTRCSIKFGGGYKNGFYKIFTYKENSPIEIGKFIEENTVKWQRLMHYSNIDKSEVSLESLYRKYPQRKISFQEIVNILTVIKSCDINFLAKVFNCKHTSVVHYLKLLENQNKIKLSESPSLLNPIFVSSNTTVLLKKAFHENLFSKILNKFVEYQEFGKSIGVENGTLSAWKVRKNRIPLPIIKRFCDALDINESKIWKNIEKVDRRIVEVI